MQKQSKTAAIFAHNVGKLRTQAGYTLKDVAKLLGVSFSAVHKWEAHNANFRFPNCAQLDNIAELYQIDVADLLNPIFSEKTARARAETLPGAMAIVANYLQTEARKSGKAG